jgi:hypothetical protein
MKTIRRFGNVAEAGFAQSHKGQRDAAKKS